MTRSHHSNSTTARDSRAHACTRPTLHSEGQSLVLIALILPFLVALALTGFEVATRLLEVAEIEDGLRQASRSSVQLLDYAALAGNHQRVDEGRVVATARTIFATNLASVRGLDEPIDALVNRVEWQVLPTGGICTLPGEGTLVAGRPERAGAFWQISFSTPAVCATVKPRLTGLLGWGVYTPTINAAETLDLLVSP